MKTLAHLMLWTFAIYAIACIVGAIQIALADGKACEVSVRDKFGVTHIFTGKVITL
jgi:hypothetical protein